MPSVTIPFTTTAPGDFTLVHGLGYVPKKVVIEYTSDGVIWFQPSRYDSEDLYMVASDTGITGFIVVCASCPSGC